MFFFFFKQKTAYEMRISDWSSDVCSSDLAYLDDGKPALASVAFYENYQKRPKGDRAADSLAYLGEALIQLKKPADACKVYAELEQVYGASLSNGLRGMMDKGRTRAKCTACGPHG